MIVNLKQIVYTIDRQHFSISLNKGELNITIQDFDAKLKTTAKVTNSELFQRLQVSKLLTEMWKQYVHQRNSPKRMLRQENGEIVIAFDYPKCQFKQFRFPCQQYTTDEVQLNLQRYRFFFQEQKEHMRKITQSCVSKIESTTKQQTQRIHTLINTKLEQITACFDKKTQQKLGQFESFYNSSQLEYKTDLKEQLQNLVKKLITDNLKIVKQFHFLKDKLEDNIQILGKNIEIVNQNIQALRIDVSQNQQRVEDEFDKNLYKIKEEMKLLQDRLNQKTKFEKKMDEKEYFNQDNCEQKDAAEYIQLDENLQPFLKLQEKTSWEEKIDGFNNPSYHFCEE